MDLPNPMEAIRFRREQQGLTRQNLEGGADSAGEDLSAIAVKGKGLSHPMPLLIASVIFFASPKSISVLSR